MNELVLEGCRPTPLAAYLKALGVLRLVAEQADPTVRGWWNGDRFRLRTNLDRERLIHFFLHDYCPTPIIAPWNGRAGFLEGDTERQAGDTSADETSEEGAGSERRGAELRRAYEKTSAVRFQPLRSAAEAYGSLPVMAETDRARTSWKSLEREIGKRKRTPEEAAEIAKLKRVEKAAKDRLLQEIRSRVAEDQFKWMDTAIRFHESEDPKKRTTNSPLLIKGGTDGSRDFGMSFGAALTRLFSIESGLPISGETETSFTAALFGDACVLSDDDSFTYFDPSQWGQNLTVGFSGKNKRNHWNFILPLEGAVLWTSGVVRRLESVTDRGAAAFPFTFEISRAGAGQLSTPDQHPSPGEIWCPLWNRPVGISEITAFFREGRLAVGKRAARTGLDAVLAVRAFGRNRGVKTFVRIGLYQSDAKMPHTAAALGRYEVGAAPGTVSLALELVDHPWLAALRREARSKDVPRELQSMVRALEDRLFEVVSPNVANTHVQDVLIALGETARLIALRPKLQEVLRPPPQLSRHWIEAADDGSPDFRLAVALAGMRARLKVNEEDGAPGPEGAEKAVRTGLGLPMRAHLAPLDPDMIMRAPAWALKQQRAAEGRILVVWGAGRLADNLCAVAQRRLLEQTRQGWSEVPFDSLFDGERNAPVAIDSGEIVAFLDGEVRDERIAELLLGLVWVQPGRWSGERRAEPLPFAYAALKPLFTPRSVFDWLKKHDRLKADIPDLPRPPALPSLLTAGRVQEAVRLAQQRARASGMPTPFLQKRAAPGRAPDPVFGRRLLAALIIPVRASVVGACLDQAYPSADQPPSDKESQDAA